MIIFRRSFAVVVALLLGMFAISLAEVGSQQSHQLQRRLDEADDFHDYDDDDEVYEVDDGMQAYGGSSGWEYHTQGDDYIQYWTEYAVLPKRCIVYKNVDVIVFTMHPKGYVKQCTDDPLGTFIAPVPYFLNGYLEDIAYEAEELGNEYEYPSAAQYISCTPYVIENQQYYFHVGCADGTSQQIAINIYSDKECTVRSSVDGYDDSNIDVSEIQLPFKKCQACVNWFDMDGEVDDQYYTKHQMTAPLCSTAWTVKQECDKKCSRTGLEIQSGWNTSDKILLAILAVFGLIMMGLIVRKRQKMSNKDALLEQAAMSAAGLQQPHVIGILVLVIVVVTVFALLGLKNITWALLLIINSALFAYLMKLTVDSGVSAGETVIGPDGTILRRDSDDSSMEDSVSRESSRRNAGTYMLPTIA